ncbi:MAG: HEAT repeat domain-containing protein [gamma proteobacterium endosymbiont of Lamellibrachia anaximandri]|nr:HEAT repeat domain-containing protein [gamma proteobacterium endosymbiont of Lamellibrachia anaximandri]MBL3533542.1 HEAT repeat domain-containing protein [gamma proteobacterium endosymbiont of Lamellibrachia anaximandri]
MNMKEKTEQSLTDLLKTGDEADRCYAARTLGTLGSRSAVEALIKQLTDEDIDACVDAAEALGRIGDTHAVPALIKSLENEESGEVCTAVTIALGQLGTDDAIPILKKVAVDRPERIEWEDDWDRWWDIQLAAVEALGKFGVEDATSTLLQIMEDEISQDIDPEIFAALANIKVSGITALLDLLENGSIMQRRRAARALGHSGNPEVTKPLGQALRDESPEVRAAVATALADIDAHRYLPALLLLLRDPEDDVRSASIEACNRLTESSSADNDIIAEITPLLSDPSSLVRAIVATTLSSLIPPRSLDEESLAAVADSLTDKTYDTAASACDLLGVNGDPASLDVLIATVRNKGLYGMVRRQATLAIGRIGILNADTIDLLKEAIADREQPVRLAALDALTALDAIPATGEETAESLQRPLDIVLAAIAGELELSSQETPQKISQAVEFDPTPIKEQQRKAEDTTTETPEAQGSELAEGESLVLPETPGRVVEPGEVNAAISTLDAIALDNAEIAFGVHEALPEPEAEVETEQEIEDFLEVVEENKRVGERMTRGRRKISIEDDVRRLGVRVLIGNTDDASVEGLIQALNADDGVLRYEAALAIAETARLHPGLRSLMNAFGSLTTQLGLGDEDQRVACARALGLLHNKAAMLPLLDILNDPQTTLRTETISALVELSINGDDPDIAGHMVIKPVSPKTILRKLSSALEDGEFNVRMAAAKGIVQLLNLEGLGESKTEIVEQLIDTGFLGAGAQARNIGKLLRSIDIQGSAERLLSQLDTVDSSAERRFVIEMLEELFISSNDRSQQAA